MRRALVVALLVIVPGRAYADAKAEAITLFDQGIKDMQAGKIEQACHELAASLAKYSDSGTKGALAECETQLGKIATAWQRWRDLADTAPTPELRADAAANADKLAPRLPHFVVKLQATAPTGLVVTVNASPVDLQVQVPLPIDPGSVVVVARAPGYREWTSRLEVKPGSSSTIEIPKLDPVPTAGRARRVVGVSLVVAGLIGVGGGAVFGFQARSKWNEATTACGGDIDHCPTPMFAQAAAAERDANSKATISTVMFGVGGAAIVVGTVMLLTGRGNGEQNKIALRITPTIGSNALAISLSGNL